MNFTKMHGIGNDYVYVDCLNEMPADPAALSIAMSPRHTAVGADGVILILPGREGHSDAKMRIFNADGSEGKMCGNGIRCVAKWLWDNGVVRHSPMRIDSLSGVKVIKVNVGDDGLVESAEVDMGPAEWTAAKVPVVSDKAEVVDEEVTLKDGMKVKINAVSMGNPHGVVFIDCDPADFDVHGRGRELETHAMWPERANIEWVQPQPDGSVKMRVWERGSGETMACGTGACAVAAAAVRTGRAKWPVTVHLIGGDLLIDQDPSTGHIIMTGPAATAFTGEWPHEVETIKS